MSADSTIRLTIATKILSLKPVNGGCSEFHTEVKKLTRPYIAISEDQWKLLMAGDHDYYRLDDGRIVTFGGADGGYALMPLQSQYAKRFF